MRDEAAGGREDEGLRGGNLSVFEREKEERERQGKRVYNLSVGTPDFEPAPHIVEAVAKAALLPENYKELS